MAKIMDPILPILSMLGYWAIILGYFGGPGCNKPRDRECGLRGLPKPSEYPCLEALGTWGLAQHYPPRHTPPTQNKAEMSSGEPEAFFGPYLAGGNTGHSDISRQFLRDLHLDPKHVPKNNWPSRLM